MAEPLKDLLLNERAVRNAAAHLQRAWRRFDATAFERRALHGLDRLELKARAMHIADALEATLPSDFEHAASVIEASLAPPLADGPSVSLSPRDDGIARLDPVAGRRVRRAARHRPTRRARSRRCTR